MKPVEAWAILGPGSAIFYVHPNAAREGDCWNAWARTFVSASDPAQLLHYRMEREAKGYRCERVMVSPIPGTRFEDAGPDAPMAAPQEKIVSAEQSTDSESPTDAAPWSRGELPEVKDARRALNALRLEVDGSIVNDLSARIEAAFAALRSQPAEALLREQYNELIMAVGQKHPGETRHQTALRYILLAEQHSDEAQGEAVSNPKERP